MGGTNLITSFEKHLVVFAQRHAEDDGRDIFETVDPLLALTPLPADVKHAAEMSVLRTTSFVQQLTVC